MKRNTSIDSVLKPLAEMPYQAYLGNVVQVADVLIGFCLNSENLRSDIANKSSDVSRAYYKGKASSKLALRSQKMQPAKVGSPLTLENCRRNLLDMEDDE